MNLAEGTLRPYQTYGVQWMEYSAAVPHGARLAATRWVWGNRPGNCLAAEPVQERKPSPHPDPGATLPDFQLAE